MLLWQNDYYGKFPEILHKIVANECTLRECANHIDMDWQAGCRAIYE